MNNKLVFVIGIVIGIVVGVIGTSYYIGKELYTTDQWLKETLIRYQFAQGLSDRCAIAIGVLKEPYGIEDNFEYDAYAEGYQIMDAEINKTYQK